MIREPMLWAVLLTTVVLTAIALWNGARWIAFQEQALAAARAHQSQALDKAKRMAADYNTRSESKVPYWRDPRDIRGYANFLMVAYAYKPPRAVAILNAGQSDVLPYYFRVNADVRGGFANSYEIENPHRLQAGKFDVGFVAIYLLPLMLIVLCYSVGAIERERGMLSLLSVQAGGFRRVWLYRIALRGGALIIAFLATALVGLTLTDVAVNDATSVLAVAAWTMVVVAYLAVWLGAILAVTAAGVSASRNAFALAALWFIFLIAVPAFVNFAVRVAHPVPTRADFVVALRDATDQINAERITILERYFLDHPEFMPEDRKIDTAPWTTTRIVTIAELERRMQTVESSYRRQLDAQQRVFSVLQYLAPPLLAQARLNAITGTDEARHQDFLSQVDRYHQTLRAYLNPRIILASKASGSRICAACPSVGGFTEFDEVPTYTYVEPDIRPDVLACIAAAGLFSLVTALLGWWGVARMRRTGH